MVGPIGLLVWWNSYVGNANDAPNANRWKMIQNTNHRISMGMKAFEKREISVRSFITFEGKLALGLSLRSGTILWWNSMFLVEQY